MLKPDSDFCKTSDLPAIPNKRYFSIGEVSELCQLKPHILRYWEQEFSKLSPNKRRGNRRYYLIEDIYLIRTIRSLLYEEGYTIQGAKIKLAKESNHKNINKTKKIEDNINNNSRLVVKYKNKPFLHNNNRQLIGELITELENISALLNS